MTNVKSLRKQLSVVMERTVMELNGHSCLSLEEVVPDKQQIISSKSFGQPVTQYEYLGQAVASYTGKA